MFKITIQIAIPQDALEDIRNRNLDELRNDPHLSGYFQVETDDLKFGFVQNKPIEAEEQGWDLPIFWLNHLMEAIKDLPIYKYVAIWKIGSLGQYLSFSLNENNFAQISEVISKDKDKPFLNEKPSDGFIKQQSKMLIPFDNLCSEVLNARDVFLKDLSEINPLFLEVDDIRSLQI